MSRYIDADQILPKMEHEMDMQDLYLPSHFMGWVIDKMPTVDVVPVVHGHWVERTDYVGDTYYDCSACGESWTTIEGDPCDNGMNYCPNCGALMDLEVTE